MVATATPELARIRRESEDRMNRLKKKQKLKGTCKKKLFIQQKDAASKASRDSDKVVRMHARSDPAKASLMKKGKVSVADEKAQRKSQKRDEKCRGKARQKVKDENRKQSRPKRKATGRSSVTTCRARPVNTRVPTLPPRKPVWFQQKSTSGKIVQL